MARKSGAQEASEQAERRTMDDSPVESPSLGKVFRVVIEMIARYLAPYEIPVSMKLVGAVIALLIIIIIIIVVVVVVICLIPLILKWFIRFTLYILPHSIVSSSCGALMSWLTAIGRAYKVIEPGLSSAWSSFAGLWGTIGQWFQPVVGLCRGGLKAGWMAAFDRDPPLPPNMIPLIPLPNAQSLSFEAERFADASTAVIAAAVAGTLNGAGNSNGLGEARYFLVESGLEMLLPSEAIDIAGSAHKVAAAAASMPIFNELFRLELQVMLRDQRRDIVRAREGLFQVRSELYDDDDRSSFTFWRTPDLTITTHPWWRPSFFDGLGVLGQAQKISRALEAMIDASRRLPGSFTRDIHTKGSILAAIESVHRPTCELPKKLGAEFSNAIGENNVLNKGLPDAAGGTSLDGQRSRQIEEWEKRNALIDGITAWTGSSVLMCEAMVSDGARLNSLLTQLRKDDRWSTSNKKSVDEKVTRMKESGTGRISRKEARQYLRELEKLVDDWEKRISFWYELSGE